MTTLADIDVGARPGEIVGGKYRVERVLGAGGMGVVVSAHHIQLDEKVALKFLLPEALPQRPSPPAVRTFRPDVPVELEAVILRCLEKKLEDRYQNIGELAVGLLPFAPASAKASVDRIAGIIQSAGLSSSAPRRGPIPTRRTRRAS